MNSSKKVQRFGQSLKASVVPPILISNTFNYTDAAVLDSGARLIYARQSNPASYMLEQTLVEMDKGVDALAFSSGMASVTTLFQSLRKGEAAVVPKTIYWPVRHWLEKFSNHVGFDVHWVESTDAELIAQAIDMNTRLIWVELLANPSLRLTDITRIAQLKPPHVLLAVDATCVTAALCQPLQSGADIVMYSGSKCLGGHNDLMAGVLVTRQDNQRWQTVRDLRWLFGNGLGAWDSSQLNRSLLTLNVRIQQSSNSALAVAQHFRHHPMVESITYVGLPESADHELARRLYLEEQFGPLLGISLKGGAEICRQVCRQVSLWVNSTGYGAVYSQIEHRYEAEYCVSQSADNYLRLSVGLEPVELLIDDLEQALSFCEVKDAA